MLLLRLLLRRFPDAVPPRRQQNQIHRYTQTERKQSETKMAPTGLPNALEEEGRQSYPKNSDGFFLKIGSGVL